MLQSFSSQVSDDAIPVGCGNPTPPNDEEVARILA